jgi:hypothetical protein
MNTHTTFWTHWLNFCSIIFRNSFETLNSFSTGREIANFLAIPVTIRDWNWLCVQDIELLHCYNAMGYHNKSYWVNQYMPQSSLGWSYKARNINQSCPYNLFKSKVHPLSEEIVWWVLLTFAHISIIPCPKPPCLSGPLTWSDLGCRFLITSCS